MTASELLQAQGLSVSNIDFIETVLVNQSVFEQKGLNQTQLLAHMSQHFPDKIYRIYLYLTLNDFTNLLHDNNIFIDGQEIIRRFRDQNLCIELGNRMLKDDSSC